MERDFELMSPSGRFNTEGYATPLDINQPIDPNETQYCISSGYRFYSTFPLCILLFSLLSSKNSSSNMIFPFSSGVLR